MIDRELLDIIACPVCKGELEDREETLECLSCHRCYPVKEGIPVLLEEEAFFQEKRE